MNATTILGKEIIIPADAETFEGDHGYTRKIKGLFVTVVVDIADGFTADLIMTKDAHKAFLAERLTQVNN